MGVEPRRSVGAGPHRGTPDYSGLERLSLTAIEGKGANNRDHLCAMALMGPDGGAGGHDDREPVSVRRGLVPEPWWATVLLLLTGRRATSH